MHADFSPLVSPECFSCLGCSNRGARCLDIEDAPRYFRGRRSCPQIVVVDIVVVAVVVVISHKLA